MELESWELEKFVTPEMIVKKKKLKILFHRASEWDCASGGLMVSM